MHLVIDIPIEHIGLNDVDLKINLNVNKSIIMILFFEIVFLLKLIIYLLLECY